MKNTLEQLEQVLASELNVHEEFLVSARQFNKAIREQDLDAIDRERAVHDATVCRIEKLEVERMSYCRVLAQSLGIKRDPVKLGMLLEKIPPQWRDRLSMLQEALKKTISELSKISTSNRILLEEGLRVVHATCSFVRQSAGSRYAPYGKHGRPVDGPVFQTMINKTA
ncbi:MAG: flagellar export chaperone FlgN [Chitinispirillaceae bacterium]|nr:flagellar export chaperone FlgN [Chitinispirillaceae bacterium]